MASFSSSEINDAKRRVQEMRRRAQNLVVDDDNKSEKSVIDNIEETEENSKNQSNQKDKTENDFLNSNSDKNSNSFALILALILILSNEEADNMLILALLYILL